MIERCVFCNNEIEISHHKTKKPTMKEIDNEHYFRNMNQEKFSISEINFHDTLAHKNCYPNKRTWHKNNCNLFKRKNGKCDCKCGIDVVDRHEKWCK